MRYKQSSTRYGVELTKATYRMHPTAARWIRHTAKAAKISQGSVINAVILDYILRKDAEKNPRGGLPYKRTRDIVNDILARFN